MKEKIDEIDGVGNNQNRSNDEKMSMCQRLRQKIKTRLGLKKKQDSDKQIQNAFLDIQYKNVVNLAPEKILS